MRFFLAQHMHLVTDRLEVDKNSIFDKVPASALDAFVIEPHGAERSNLCFVCNDVDLLASILEVAGLQFIKRCEAGAGIICLIAKDAVKLQRMSDRFMYCQSEMVWLQHKIVLAWFNRLGCYHFLCLPCSYTRVFNNVVTVLVEEGAHWSCQPVFGLRDHVFIAHTHRRAQCIPCFEFSRRPVDDGYCKRRP